MYAHLNDKNKNVDIFENNVEDRQFYESFASTEQPRKKTLAKRFCARMGPGSLRGSQLTLIASMIGVGFLTLPTIGTMNGWVAIIFFVLLAQSISLIGNLQIGRAYRICGKKTYSAIVESIIGKVMIIPRNFQNFNNF